jgi:dTDP-4-amino-4,6-dideoxygalactose transaminase
MIETFMARDALALAVSTLGLTRSDDVLLPAYLCGEVLRPFAVTSNVRFYDVRSDLSVELEAIEAKLRTGNVKVVLIINYFGFLQPFRSEIKQLCAERGVTLIEDCAHSLLTEGSGEVGDLSVYSYRKFLPVPDGGALKVNARGLDVHPVFYPSIVSNGLAIGAVLRSVFDFKTDVLSRAWMASRCSNTPAADAPRRTRLRTLRPSMFSRNGIGNVSLPEIFQKRRADFEYWLEQTRERDDVRPIFKHLPDGVCPLGFPVTAMNRDHLKRRLEEAGVVSTIEWRLPSAISGEFLNSRRLSAHVLTLPVYPLLEESVGSKRARLL